MTSLFIGIGSGMNNGGRCKKDLFLLSFGNLAKILQIVFHKQRMTRIVGILIKPYLMLFMRLCIKN